MRSGIYRHYKNNHEYEFLGLAKNSNTLETMVIYKGLYDHPEFGHDVVWVRPYSQFTEMIEWEGKKVLRFEWMRDR